MDTVMHRDQYEVVAMLAERHGISVDELMIMLSRGTHYVRHGKNYSVTLVRRSPQEMKEFREQNIRERFRP